MASRDIGALWLKKSAAGQDYMSGTLYDLSGDIQIAIFRNDRKEKDNQPDYKIVLSEPREKREERKDRPPTADVGFFGGASASAAVPQNDAGEVNIDDIPF